ncbi:MAG TPA: adenylate/guanylate cyclase domain-containing protein [Microvirga sp.]|nr:adenylate/guanylate cyclase domain-containing protein [Microvirga sp.]
MEERVPAPEAERLAALASYRVLDTPPEFEFDALTELAAEICGCPAALISIIDERRAWLKSKYGLPEDLIECPREITMCNTSLCANDLIYVPDLTLDDRFKHSPLVTSEPHLRFYCGMPLINREGYAIGTLCIVDFAPRELTPSQRGAVRRLAQQAMAQLELRRQLLVRDALVREISEAKAAAEAAWQRSEMLLRSILPEPIALEMKAKGRVEPRYHESVTILFADFKGFTRLTETFDPASLLSQLERNFARFDEIARANRLEMLKIIGDAYVCAGGLVEPTRTHAIDACVAALQVQKFVREANQQRHRIRLAPWELRIGVNTGPVVAGIIGKQRFSYEVWGNAVNIAQRLEEACMPGRVNISANTLDEVAPFFETEPRGSVEVKHLGTIDMYFVNRLKPAFSADADGCVPTEDLRRLSRVH